MGENPNRRVRGVKKEERLDRISSELMAGLEDTRGQKALARKQLREALSKKRGDVWEPVEGVELNPRGWVDENGGLSEALDQARTRGGIAWDVGGSVKSPKIKGTIKLDKGLLPGS